MKMDQKVEHWDDARVPRRQHNLTVPTLPSSCPPVESAHGSRLQLRRTTKRVGRILVPYDFSPCSALALNQAALWARRHGTTITLLHVIDLNLHSPLGETVKWDCWKDAVRKLDEAILALADERVEVEAQILEGRPAAVIVEAARRFDLIAIGKRKPGLFWRLFSRGTAERVLNLAPCPVLIVGERRTPAALQQPQHHEIPAGSL